MHLQLQKASSFPKINLTDKNTGYVSDSAWSLRARCPSQEPGRTHTAKASSNTILFFINISLIIWSVITTLPPWSSQYLNSHCPGGSDTHELKGAMYTSSSTLIVFSWFFCLTFIWVFPPSYENVKMSFIVFFVLFFLSLNQCQFQGRVLTLPKTPARAKALNDGRKTMQSEVAVHVIRSAVFNHVHCSSQNDVGFAAICTPKMMSQYHPLSGEELAVWWLFST